MYDLCTGHCMGLDEINFTCKDLQNVFLHTDKKKLNLNANTKISTRNQKPKINIRSNQM